MRKLTGYIGALIIVFALMGSIFAGYALNVNGSSSVINEYERVTDVSGLYSHSQEPNYIDYNPASNYIGYGFETSVYENTGLRCLKMIVGDTATITNSQITFKDKTYANVDDTILWCHVGFLIKSGSYLGWRGIGHIGGISSFTITKSSETSYTIQSDFGTENWTNSDKLPIFIYYPYNDYDSVGPYNGQMIYYNNLSDDIFYAGSISPAIPNGDERFVSWGTWGIRTVPGNLTSGTLTAPAIEYTNEQDVSTGVKQANVRVYNSITSGGVTYSYGNQGIFTNRYVYPTDTIGINYTESSRVNNYPVPGNNESPTITENQTINISNLSGITNYYPANQYDYHVIMYKNNNVGMSNVGVKYSNIGLEMPYKPLRGDNYEFVNYKLSDILTNGATIPNNTKTIKIELNSTNQVAYDRDLNQTNVISYCDLNVPCLNDGTFQNTTVPVPHFRNYTMETNNGFGTKDYAIYNIGDNTVTVYTYDGVKKSVLAPENCYIVSPKLSGFDPSDQPLLVYSYEYREPSNGNNYWEITDYYYNRASGNPYSSSNNYTTNINLTYYIQENPDNKYFDITKGYSIKNDNVTNVIWDNEYNNGNIQLLFRAENANATYHNDIIIGDNTISIDYNDGFSVTLNGGDPVAVGKWRNIVLNMDLRTGELSAIPVRTFNSYTNVVLDTASIFIGDMINPTPTNKIEWAPTSNSLMFNVYSTAVFMNTYGVVMVNPQLDITDYFTDLNGFYRMRLYNFSVLGSSITVNGITADVNNNSITIDEQTVQIKDMAITYADGHAYMSDSNVNIDLGEIVNNNISMAGAWYFETELLKGYTSQKMVYTWDWGDFILNNTQFCIMYIGIALIGLIVARRYCSLSITDYIVLIASFAIALTVQVVA